MTKGLMRFMMMLAAMIVVGDAFADTPVPRRGLLGNRTRPANNATAQADGRPRTSAPTEAEGGESTRTENKDIPALNWDAAPVDIVLQAYADQLDKTYLKDPAVPNATITLKSREGQKMTQEEYLEAIEVILEMNGIHIEPYGEKFLRVLPRKEVRKEGIPIIMDSETRLADSGKVVSMMVQLKNISTEDGQKTLDNFKSGSGIIIGFERTNSILITDTEANINRMLEIIRCIDVATPVLENVFVRQIKNASAADIKTALEAIVQESQKELEKSGGKNANIASQNNATRPSSTSTLGSRLLGGNKGNQPAAPVSNSSVLMQVSDADRGMIRGKVLILADDRSNKLVIVTQKPNMDFFDKVIEQLDVETTPDTVVKVYRLKYADAEEVSDMINDLIGNAGGSKSSGKDNQNRNSKTGSNSNMTRNTSSGGSATAVNAQRKSANQRTGEAQAGELTKDNTTVLADKRINGLVVMTEKELVPTLESIIESMDVKLSQVLIETVIIEVGLNDDLKTGIDWVKGMGSRNGGKSYESGIAGGGGDPFSLSNGVQLAAKYLPAAITPGGQAGLTYAILSEKLDLGAVISMSQSDSHSKYLASPVIMTVDNKEATIEATQMRYLFKGYQYSGSSMYGSPVPDYEQKELGITIKTTPKINPNGTVALTVEEEYSQEGASQPIESATQQGGKTTFNAATTITRKMSSDVSLENGQTVVLGGLINTYKTESETGIPILKDIPWIGKYLFGKTQTSEQRNELIVFMTPYVLSDADAAEAEAIRRRNAISDRHAWEDHGWSKSVLAEPVSRKEQLRRLKEEWKKQDAERAAKIEIEQEKLKRVEKLEKMSKKEREAWLEVHKKELEEEAQDALEEKMLDDDSQEELKKLAEEIRVRKLKEANETLDKTAEEAKQENEFSRLSKEVENPPAETPAR